MTLVIRWPSDAARVPAIGALIAVIAAGGALMRMSVTQRINGHRAAATALALDTGARMARAVAADGRPVTCIADPTNLASIVGAADVARLAGAGFDYELWCTLPREERPQLITRSASVDLSHPVTHSTGASTGVWTVALAPAAGWLPWPLVASQGLLVLVAALIAALKITDLARRPEQLRAELRERDRRLKAVHQQLTDEIKRRQTLELRGSADAVAAGATHAQFDACVMQAQQRAQADATSQVAVFVISFARLTKMDGDAWTSADEEMMLQAVRRLQRCLGPRQHAIARAGDAAVALLLVDVRSSEAARAEAWQLYSALATAFTIGGQRIYANPDIGIAMAETGRETAADLLRAAHTALERAIADAGSGVSIFNPSGPQRPPAARRSGPARSPEPNSSRMTEAFAYSTAQAK